MLKFDINEYVGDVVNQEILTQYFRPNGNGYNEFKECKEYIAYFYEISENLHLRETLKITNERKVIWNRRAIDLRLYIWIDQDNIIRGIKPHKYQELYAGPGRPHVDELDPIQDELRIMKLLLDLNRSKTK